MQNYYYLAEMGNIHLFHTISNFHQYTAKPKNNHSLSHNIRTIVQLSFYIQQDRPMNKENSSHQDPLV